MPTLKKQDASLYYQLEGEGPPVVFIQGVGVVGEGWRPQIQGLAPYFKTLIFDNRGIGKSQLHQGSISVEAMAADVKSLMDELGWDSAHLVGHSLGGIIAQQFALTYPKRVRSLSLLCTFAKGSDGAKITPRLLWLGLQSRIGTRSMRRQAFLRMLFSKAYLAGLRIPEVLAVEIGSIIGRDLSDSPPIIMKQLKALGAHNASQRLHELNGIKTLIVSGVEDPIALPEYGRELAKNIPGAQYEELTYASHGLVFEKTDILNLMLKNFLANNEGQST